MFYITMLFFCQGFLVILFNYPIFDFRMQNYDSGRGNNSSTRLRVHFGIPSDLSENVGDVGFVKGGKPKAFAAEVFQGGANKVKFLVIDDQKTVVERQTGLDNKTAILRIEFCNVTCGKLVTAGRCNYINRHAIALLRKHVKR